MGKLKIDAERYHKIKMDIKQRRKVLRELVSRRQKVSVLTIRRIENSESFPEYQALTNGGDPSIFRESSLDRKDGMEYEDSPMPKRDFVRSIKNRFRKPKK